MIFKIVFYIQIILQLDKLTQNHGGIKYGVKNRWII